VADKVVETFSSARPLQ